VHRDQRSQPQECRTQKAAASEATPALTNAKVAIWDDVDSAILSFVQKAGNASPRDIHNAIDLPKTTAFRRLARLVDAGLLMRSGKTTAIRYRINELPEKRQEDSRKCTPPADATSKGERN
jgi:hypothetical protein